MNKPKIKLKIKFKFICLASFILVVLNNNYVIAQQFKYKSSLSSVSLTSLYKVELSPLVQNYCFSNYKDLRVVDSNGIQKPYFILSEPILKSASDFIKYTIVSQNHYNNYTEIVIENSTKEKISNIAFNINNSEALKLCTIEGSDDLKQWYSISKLQTLSLSYNEQYTNQYKCLYFPLSNYKYYRLLIDDWSSEPFKVNSAGYFKNSLISGKLNRVTNSFQLSTNPNQKSTTIKLSISGNQSVQQLVFKISQPHLFLRKAFVYYKEKIKVAKQIETEQKQIIKNFTLNSNEPLIVDIPETQKNELYIDIENEDNEALQIDSVITNQLARFLIFDATQNQQYFLKCGNDSLQLPNYDIINFVNGSPQFYPELKFSNFENIEIVSEIKNKQPQFFESKLFIWIAISVCSLIIGLFSIKMIKNLK